MKNLIKLFLIICMALVTTLIASEKVDNFDKVVSFKDLKFSQQELNRDYPLKTANISKQIAKKSAGYEAYLVELVGDTSCGDRYEKYASNVEDALISQGINPQNIKLTYFRLKTGTPDCALSRSVKVKLYLKNIIETDEDKDGVLDKYDKCPHTLKNALVSEDGCAHKTTVVLLAGRKSHTAIIVKTSKGSLKIDKPLELVTLDSAKTISKPKIITEAELKLFTGKALAFSNNKQYTFVFYFNKLDLRTESEKKIQKMLDILTSLNKPYINLIGNTDTIGSREENRKLGFERAQVIANVIRLAGVKYLKMDISSDAEENLAIPTSDEKKELLNRRVEVLIE